MQKLPIGIQTFEKIRQEDYLYVDKTKQILKMIEQGECYFLSRPRRFGKSLTLSTLEAMFQGKAELFKGLYVEEWVKEQAKHPNPVIRLDMSVLKSYNSIEELNEYLVHQLKVYLFLNNYNVSIDEKADIFFVNIITKLYHEFGSVVVLIDEYDNPITDNMDNLEQAEKVRKYLRSFYLNLKTYSKYLRFVMITGISKFTKAGVFSGLNNLKDISISKEYGDMLGYTQKELENNFGEWIDKAKNELSMSREELLEKIKEYYDGFSFDGITKVYNPFSVLNFFGDKEFKNYWYISGSPSFLHNYLQRHHLKNPDKYEEIVMPEMFLDKHEIETAPLESFLFQTGYLTIKKKENGFLTLGYPNEEVKNALADMYLDDVYHIEGYLTLGNKLWKALEDLEDDNAEELIKTFNLTLTGLPYEDFTSTENKDKESEEFEAFIQSEYWYRSLFVMLLRSAGVIYYAEVHTYKGRSDVIINFKNKIVVVEFKYAKNSKVVASKRKQGKEQIQKYLPAYAQMNKKVIGIVLVANGETRQIAMPKKRKNK